MAVAGGEKTPLEFTPTWVVALVCFSIVLISVTVDQLFLFADQILMNSWPLQDAARKIRHELMLLGFLSLLLAVFQTQIGKICISEQLNNGWLPCKKSNSSSSVANFTTSSLLSSGKPGRRLLTMASDTADYCSQKGKMPLLSVEAIHHLHIFIFVLATFHVVLGVLKVQSMRCQWYFLKKQEEELQGDGVSQQVLEETIVMYQNPPNVFRYMHTPALQKAYTSMTKFEYNTLRLNFIAAHGPQNAEENFQRYIIRTSRKEFEKMMGFSWYLWLLALIYLLVNVAGWNAYFWISFFPLILLKIIAFELEEIMMKHVKTVAEKHRQNQTEAVYISDGDFWLRRHDVVGHLIHIVLFVNSLELAFFFFVLFQYGFHSCIMGKVGFVVPRIVIGVFVQYTCAFRTIPLYAIIESQMHLRESQSDEPRNWCHQIDIIRILLNECPRNERREDCLGALDRIQERLDNYEMGEEKEMRIVTWILRRYNRRATRNGELVHRGSRERIESEIRESSRAVQPETQTPEIQGQQEEAREIQAQQEASINIELARMGSRDGAVVDEITQDVEAQNPQPSLHQHSQ